MNQTFSQRRAMAQVRLLQQYGQQCFRYSLIYRESGEKHSARYWQKAPADHYRAVRQLLGIEE